MKVENTLCYVQYNRETLIPLHEFMALAVQKSVLEVAVNHEVVDEEETAPFGVGREPHGGDDLGGAAEHGGEEELVVELALALLGGRGGVHELHGDGGSRRRRERAGEDGAEAAVAEGGGKGVGGSAEEGVG